MGKNYSYRITFDPDNPKHMRVAELLDKLGRGELRQYIVDCVILAETITSQQKDGEALCRPCRWTPSRFRNLPMTRSA